MNKITNRPVATATAILIASGSLSFPANAITVNEAYQSIDTAFRNSILAQSSSFQDSANSVARNLDKCFASANDFVTQAGNSIQDSFGNITPHNYNIKNAEPLVANNSITVPNTLTHSTNDFVETAQENVSFVEKNTNNSIDSMQKNVNGVIDNLSYQLDEKTNMAVNSAQSNYNNAIDSAQSNATYVVNSASNQMQENYASAVEDIHNIVQDPASSPEYIAHRASENVDLAVNAARNDFQNAVSAINKDMSNAATAAQSDFNNSVAAMGISF